MKQLKNYIGFDLGTYKWRIYKEGRQIGEISAKIPIENVRSEKIMITGRISSFNHAQVLLREEIKKMQTSFLGIFSKTFTAMVSIPSEYNEISIRAYRDLFEFSGAKTVGMLMDCYIAATGLGIAIPSQTTSMIVDCGAGKTSITTFKDYDIINNDLFDIAGDIFNEAIRIYLRSKYGLIVDLSTIERIKTEYVDLNSPTDVTILIAGKDKASNLTKNIQIQSNELTLSLHAEINLLIERIVRHLESLTDEHKKSISNTGVYLIGGSFKLPGLIDRIAERIPVAKESYNNVLDYMKIGFERIQQNPGELERCLIL